MDLGISGKSALLSGASRGLGKACAMALAREGVDVTIVARTPRPSRATARKSALRPASSRAGCRRHHHARAAGRRRCGLPAARHPAQQLPMARCRAIFATGRVTTGSPRSTR